jgi:hypothetical protein
LKSIKLLESWRFNPHQGTLYLDASCFILDFTGKEVSYVDYSKTSWAKSGISRVSNTSSNVYGFEQTKLVTHSGDIVDDAAGDKIS